MARRCGVQETILYRIWPDKRAMFVAAVEWVFQQALDVYERELAEVAPERRAEHLLDYEADHLGESGHYRVLFAGLGELDDADVRRALRDAYRRFAERLEIHAGASRLRAGTEPVAPELAAWAIVGVGTIATIGRELRMFDRATRRSLIAEIGRALVGARRAPGAIGNRDDSNPS